MSHLRSVQWLDVSELDEQQQKALSLLQRYGRHATSFQILEGGYHYWFHEQYEAVIAYIEHHQTRVVAGPPIAPPNHLPSATQAFLEDCHKKGFRAVFVSVDAEFLETIAQKHTFIDLLPIGEQPEWSLSAYTTNTPKHRTLRSQVRRAERKGVLVRMLSEQEVSEDDGQILAEIAWIVEQWKSSRKMSPLQFMVALEPFHLPSQRRYFIATHERRPVGVLIAIPVYAQKGWFFEDVLRVPDAPNGTVELLIHSAMETFKEEGYEYATLGLCPLVTTCSEKDSVKETPEHPLLRKVMNWAYEHFGSLYQFKGLYAFKQRFVPQVWAKQYIATIGHPLGVRDLFAVVKALFGDGILSFAWDTFRRLLTNIPSKVWANGLFLFGSLLLPWTILIASIDGTKWFGNASVQGAWVVFDSFLIVAWFLLGFLVKNEKPSASSASVFVAGATLTDFVLTAVQVFHLHQNTMGWPVLFVFAGVMGPLLSTLFLVAFSLRRTS